MKAMVDPSLCTGCEACVNTCPEVFVMGKEVAEVRVDTVPSKAEETCREAAEGCPVEAISLED